MEECVEIEKVYKFYHCSRWCCIWSVLSRLCSPTSARNTVTPPVLWCRLKTHFSKKHLVPRVSESYPLSAPDPLWMRIFHTTHCKACVALMRQSVWQPKPNVNLIWSRKQSVYNTKLILASQTKSNSPFISLWLIGSCLFLKLTIHSFFLNERSGTIFTSKYILSSYKLHQINCPVNFATLLDDSL